MLKVLKENLSLLALMVVLVGTSSTDAYYALFGLRYEFINIPAAHILFRGLTAVWAFPLLALLFLLALAFMAFQSSLALWLGGMSRLRWVNHTAVAAFVVLAWYGGTYAGTTAARLDMASATSSLPVVAKITPKTAGDASLPTSPNEGYRLLLQGADGIRIFKTVANPRTESPLVRYIAMGGIDAVTVCARC